MAHITYRTFAIFYVFALYVCISLCVLLGAESMIFNFYVANGCTMLKNESCMVILVFGFKNKGKTVTSLLLQRDK